MSNSDLEAGYRLMLLSRAIDDMCDELEAQGVPSPNYHGARGQEAMYAGVGVALEKQDYLLYNYRAFATLLAKGIHLEQLMGDLLSTKAGTTQGHGGIMHVNDPARGVVGRNGVFGSKFGIALGLAIEIQLNERQAVVVCMFGEAEGNRGGLYESLNIAALRSLPIVFVAENNGFAVAAPTDLLYATGDMSGGLSGFPLDVSKVDGNDFGATSQAITRAVASARSGGGPAFIECITLRLDPHHAHDDQSKYRTEADLAEAWAGEPIAVVERELAALGWTAEAIERERAAARKQVIEAASAARQAGPADAAVIENYTYFTGAHR